MAKKPLRIFKNGQLASAKKRVYQGSSDVDRSSITQQVLEHPDALRAISSSRSDKYFDLLHCIYDAVIMTNKQGSIFEVNARAEHFFMLSAVDLKKINIIDLIAGADYDLIKIITDNVSDRKFTVLEAVCLRADQSKFNAEIVVNAIKINGDNLCFFIRDITERKEQEAELQKANEKLIEAESLQTRIDTLTTLFHELNNPMQILMCMAEIDNNPEYKKQVNKIMSILNQLKQDKALNKILDENGNTIFQIEQEKEIKNADSRKILIADDEEILRKMFSQTIQTEFPYLNIDLAINGFDAVEKFEKEHYGLIIMDVSMPELNGEQAYQKIEEICKTRNWELPKVIFCTGFIVSDYLQEVIGDKSTNTCLQKPLSMIDLIQVVKSKLATDQT